MPSLVYCAVPFYVVVRAIAPVDCHDRNIDTDQGCMYRTCPCAPAMHVTMMGETSNLFEDNSSSVGGTTLASRDVHFPCSTYYPGSRYQAAKYGGCTNCRRSRRTWFIMQVPIDQADCTACLQNPIPDLPLPINLPAHSIFRRSETTTSQRSVCCCSILPD